MARLLTSLEVDPAAVRTEVLPLLDGHEARSGEEPPQRTPNTDRALELAIRMGPDHLGCEHLLLGLVTEEEGLGGRILRSMGLDATVARRAVVAALAGFVHRVESAEPEVTDTARRWRRPQPPRAHRGPRRRGVTGCATAADRP